jgi:toxin ParE1/3/4
MKAVVFHTAAREEYKEAIRHYHSIDPDLQAGFRAGLRSHIEQIRSNPLLYNVRKYNVRRANFERFAFYYIAYMIWKDQMVIVAVGHSRKRPYYWYRRPKNFRDTH